MHRKLLAVGLGLIVLIGASLFISGFLDLAVVLGQNIPQEDLATDYIYGVTWAMFIGISILLWPVPARDKPLLLRGWLVKSLVTVVLMLLYENNYGLDAYWHFDLTRHLGFSPQFPRLGAGTPNIRYLCWLHHQIFPESYHMMKVSFSLCGFIAVYIFYRAIVLHIEREDSGVFYGLMLFPSIVFWSSILGKDPVILLGIALYCYGVIAWHKTGGLRFLLLIGAGIVETMFIRTWMGMILLTPLTIFPLRHMRGGPKKLLFLTAVAWGFFGAIGQFKERFAIETRQDLVAAAQTLSQGFARGGSGQVLEMEFTGLGQMIGFLPLGIFTALFRPLPGELLSPFAFLASLENLAILLILLRGIRKTRLRELGDPIVMWAVALILTWSAVYGGVSYANLGTASRFKLQVLPVLVALLMHLNRRRALLASPRSQPRLI